MLKLTDPVICHWPEKLPQPCAGFVTGLCPAQADGIQRVNVLVLIDGHHCHQRHFAAAMVFTDPPANLAQSVQWVEPVYVKREDVIGISVASNTLSDETGPAIPAPEPKKGKKGEKVTA